MQLTLTFKKLDKKFERLARAQLRSKLLFYPKLISKLKCFVTFLATQAVVVGVVQLAEWRPPTLEFCGSNPVFGKLLINICLLSNVL